MEEEKQQNKTPTKDKFKTGCGLWNFNISVCAQTTTKNDYMESFEV